MLSRLLNEVEVESEVVDGEYLESEHLLRVNQMSCVRSGVRVIDVGRAVGIEFGEVILPFLIAEVHHALPGKDHPVASVAGRHDAVEHIDASFDSFEDVPRRSDAHEVTGFGLGQDIVADLDHVVHDLGRFAYGETADGVAVPVQIPEAFAGLLAQFGIGASLHDGEEVLLIAVEVVGGVKPRDAAVEPSVGAVHRVLGVFLIRRTGAALVEGHHDVRTDLAFDVHDRFGGKEELAAVDMTAEPYAFFGHLTDVGEGKDLESAAVGEDGSVPSLEGMQSAGATEDVRAGTEEEMVGVTENDLGLDVVLEFLALHALDGTYGTDGHEDGGEDISVVGMDDPGARSDTALTCFEFEECHS